MSSIAPAFVPVLGTSTPPAPIPAPDPQTPPVPVMNALVTAWLEDAARTPVPTRSHVPRKRSRGRVSRVLAFALWWRNDTVTTSEATATASASPTPTPEPTHPQPSALYRSLYFARGCTRRLASREDLASLVSNSSASLPDFLLSDNSALGIGLLDELREKAASGKKHVFAHVFGAIGVFVLMLNPLRS